MNFLFKQPVLPAQRRFPEVDLLRFFAAVMVVFYHFTASGTGNTAFSNRYNLIATRDLFSDVSNLTQFGFLGVNLFFLISGFIIFSSAANRTAIDFAVFRWIRLFPTYWLSIVFTLGVLVLFLGFNFKLPTMEIILNFTMLQSYLGARHLDPVYWTLVVELHFYFLIFLLLATRQLPAWRFWVSLWLASSWGYTLIEQPFFLNYIFETQYAGYFIAGMIFYSRTQSRLNLWSAAVLLGSLLLCWHYLPDQLRLYNFGQTSLINIWIGRSVILFFFFLFGLISAGKLQFRSTSKVVLLGSLTYPLYLTHHQFGRYFIDYFSDTMPRYLLLAITISLCLAIAFIFFQISDQKIAPALKKLYFSILTKRAESTQ